MKTMPPNAGFLDFDPELSVSYADARAVVIPFGLESSVSYGGGTRFGPEAIIAASRALEYFDETVWCEPCHDIGIVTLPPPKIASSQSQALQQLDTLVQQVIDDGKFPLVLGGEHAITAGCIRPFAKRFDDLVIVQFDAHADLRDGYLGEHYSHASAMRRCLDDAAVNRGGSQISLLSLGIRSISAEEIPFYEQNQHRVKILWADSKPHWSRDSIIDFIRDRPVYLTFDVDGFDASLMPATGTPEPGGLFWDMSIDLIKLITQHATVIGADVVELAPIPRFHACDFTAAKLAYKILVHACYTKK